LAYRCEPDTAAPDCVWVISLLSFFSPARTASHCLNSDPLSDVCPSPIPKVSGLWFYAALPILAWVSPFLTKVLTPCLIFCSFFYACFHSCCSGTGFFSRTGGFLSLSSPDRNILSKYPLSPSPPKAGSRSASPLSPQVFPPPPLLI